MSISLALVDGQKTEVKKTDGQKTKRFGKMNQAWGNGCKAEPKLTSAALIGTVIAQEQP